MGANGDTTQRETKRLMPVTQWN